MKYYEVEGHQLPNLAQEKVCEAERIQFILVRRKFNSFFSVYAQNPLNYILVSGWEGETVYFRYLKNLFTEEYRKGNLGNLCGLINQKIKFIRSEINQKYPFPFVGSTNFNFCLIY